MNRTVFYKAICLSLFLAAAHVSNAQEKTTVKATVDKNRIFIGERINLTLEADIPENEAIRFFIIDTIPHFEMEKQQIDTSNTSEGTYLRQVISITSFDSGHWVIPSFALGDRASTDTIPIDVTFSPMDTAQSYHDIKDIIEVNPAEEKKKTWLWYIVGGASLLVILIIFLLLRKKKPVVTAAAPVVNPYDEAMDELGKLQRGKPDQKQYYSRLVDIFRLYVMRKKDIHSLQKTTDDLVVQLRSVQMSKDQFEKLSQSLRLSDFVKFAKYVPSEEDDRFVFDTIKQSIAEIEQVK